MAKSVIRISWNRTALLPYKAGIPASKNYQRFAFSKSPSKQKLFREVKAWFWDEEVDRVFSFRSICGVIGLDPVYLRRGLRQWVADPQHEKSRRKGVLLHSTRSRTRQPTISLQDISGTARRPDLNLGKEVCRCKIRFAA